LVDLSASAVDADGAGVVVDDQVKAEFGQAFEHDERVVGEEDVGEIADAVGQRREDEGAVGEALGAGRGEAGGEGLRERVETDVGHDGDKIRLEGDLL